MVYKDIYDSCSGPNFVEPEREYTEYTVTKPAPCITILPPNDVGGLTGVCNYFIHNGSKNTPSLGSIDFHPRRPYIVGWLNAFLSQG